MSTQELYDRMSAAFDAPGMAVASAAIAAEKGHKANVAGKFYLTNGYIAIRLDSDKGTPLPVSAASSLSWPDAGNRDVAAPWPANPTQTGARTPCDHKCITCHGKGVHRCYECGHEAKCEECDGKGSWGLASDCHECHGKGYLGDTWRTVCGVRFSEYLHELVASLPGACYLPPIPPARTYDATCIPGFFEGGEFVLAGEAVKDGDK
jgi:hypothetical protein